MSDRLIMLEVGRSLGMSHSRVGCTLTGAQRSGTVLEGVERFDRDKEGLRLVKYIPSS